MGTTHELFVSLSLGTTGIALTSVLLVTFYGVFEDYSYDVTLEFWGCGYLQMTNELGEKSFFMCAFTPLGAQRHEGLPGRGHPGCHPSAVSALCSDSPLCSLYAHHTTCEGPATDFVVRSQLGFHFI